MHGGTQKLALALAAKRKYSEALIAVDHALALNIKERWLYDARGQVLLGLERFEEAIEEMACAVSVAPNSAVAYNNRGVTLRAAGRLDEAFGDFDRAIALDAHYAHAIVNLGTLLKDLGRFEDALDSYQTALGVAPDHGEANWNIVLLALMRGDFEAGWAGYEWRWKIKVQAGGFLRTEKPQWCGQNIAGKTILILVEQCYGDYIQFCRYFPLLAIAGANVIEEVPPRLMRLVARLDGDITFVAAGAHNVEFDIHCPLMSLPLAFGTRIESVPAETPYLSAKAARVETLRTSLGPGPHVGLVWLANIQNIHGLSRHMPAQCLEVLLELPLVFHVVQKEFRLQDKVWLEGHPNLPVYVEAQTDFLEAVALLAAMDLIITVDTAVAHLAGALGKPVWVLLPHIPDWRWMMDREDTPWYSTMRLFRQPMRGDWDGAIAAVRMAFRDTSFR